MAVITKLENILLIVSANSTFDIIIKSGKEKLIV